MTSHTIYATHLNPDFATDCLLDWSYAMSLKSPYPPDLAIITIHDPCPSCFGLPAAIGSAAVDDDVTEVGYGCEVRVVFDWLVHEGGSPASPVSSFGSAQ